MRAQASPPWDPPDDISTADGIAWLGALFAGAPGDDAEAGFRRLLAAWEAGEPLAAEAAAHPAQLRLPGLQQLSAAFAASAVHLGATALPLRVTQCVVSRPSPVGTLRLCPSVFSHAASPPFAGPA